MSCVRLALSIALASAIGVVPQTPLATAETKHLRLSTSVSKSPAAGKFSLVVDVTPKPTMHVYAPGQKDYIVVSVTLEPVPGVTPSPPIYPKGEKFVMPALNETQLVYSKPFRIVQDVTVPAGGPLTLKGTLRYQACDDAICYLPVNVSVTWTIPQR
jgi:DsbC/DsbD-like thiol-disulfide interchange protein